MNTAQFNTNSYFDPEYADFGQRLVKNNDNKLIIETFQDVSTYLRNNKRMYDENQTNKHAASWRKDNTMGWHKASIPNVIYHKWMKEFQTYTGDPLPPRITNEAWKTFLKRKLRDPENRYLRVDGRKD